MLQQLRAVGNAVSDLTGPKFELQNPRSRDERVTARPTAQLAHWCCDDIVVKDKFTKYYRQ